MRLRDVIVVWTPGTADVAIIEKRELQASLEFREKRQYVEIAGPEDGKTEEQRQLAMLVQFTKLVVQDGVPVQAAQLAFRRLQYFRSMLGE